MGKGEKSLDLYLILYTNINSQWTIDLNIKAGTIISLYKYIGEYLHDLGTSKKKFQDTESTDLVRKFDKLDVIKIVNVCQSVIPLKNE